MPIGQSFALRDFDLGRSKDGGRVLADIHLDYTANGPKPEGVAELGISFSHTEKGHRLGDSSTSYGQLSDLEFQPGTLGYAIRFIWKGYHLNAMQAGCEHQRAAGWTYDDHPSEACPVCGYRFGSAWLTAPLPEDVIAWLHDLYDRRMAEGDAIRAMVASKS